MKQQLRVVRAMTTVLALVGCGDRGGPAAAAKVVDTRAAPADAGVDALTDEQRNQIALDAFLAADRLATDTRRTLLDAQAHQAAEVRLVMQWLHAVRDKTDYDDSFLDEDDRDAVEALMAANPQLDAELMPDGVRVSTKDDLIAVGLESATLTFTIATDTRGKLTITKLVVDAPHDSGEMGCFPEE